MTKYSVEEELGCGLMGRIFQRWSNRSRKSSVPALPAKGINKPVTDKSKKPSTDDSRRRRTSSVDSVLQDSSNLAKPLPKQDQKPTRKSDLLPPRNSISTSHQRKDSRRTSDAARSSTTSSSSSSQTRVSQTQSLTSEQRKLQKESSGSYSKEIAKVFTADEQQSNNSKALIRATSSNVMLVGQLGNLRQLGAGSALGNNSPNATIKAEDDFYQNLPEARSTTKPPRKNSPSKLGGFVMGNIVRQPSDESKLFHGPMSRLDPDALKNMGNEAYKQGRFEEALTLYERAISLDSKQATYRCNKSAALLGLDRLLEAVFECKEAIQLDPTYCRAHRRLATIYLRLGEAEQALFHYKHAGNHADSTEIAEAQALNQCLKRCSDAQKLNEWNTLLKETQCAITSGVDSAPQVYALQAEALLKLHRHQEAYTAYMKGPNFAIESCINFFGLAVSAYLLMIRALVYMVSGRLEDAVSAAQHAAKLDPGNKEISLVVKRTRAVSSARLSGNLLFKASKFLEACIVYGEGLEHDPYNSVLLCNRAACRSKLRQFEKAIEDCTAAFNVQPSYSKARLRRADCNAKLERWEAAIQDYEMLIRETPGDEEVARALFEAQVQIKKQRGEDIKDMKFGSNLVMVSSNERFRHFVTSPGMTVVLFCNKAKHKQVLQLMEQVCKRFPSVNFLKVEVEDHPYLAKSEAVTSIPAFKIYKNGSRVKEVPGNNPELLERSVKLYSS
ncbi:Tetratricopeptide repeat-containing protein, putative isoform 1 [Theobroma cacao]|uniref:Tetratricopeptide repeat-containing protein, putative isoform 1 n=1 Tax=Theobroma cacao TaxID=3641 RepID=A0A061FGI8_THECC|nr:Tetratricopeptide repeat-containing protein, putative isoform 1 [Theobroma cacao]